MIKNEYLSLYRRLLLVILRALLLKQCRLIPLRARRRHAPTTSAHSAPLRLCVRNLLRRGSIACRDKLLQTEAFESLREEAREVAPLGIVTRKKDRLAAKDVGIVVDIGVHLSLNVVQLGVEFVVLRVLRI